MTVSGDTPKINPAQDSGSKEVTDKMNDQADQTKAEIKTYDTTAMQEMMNMTQASSNLNIMTTMKMNMIQFEQSMMTTILRGLQWK